MPAIVNVSTTYGESFINSDDAEIGPGIDAALLDKGIIWAQISNGTVVTVQFNDGTKAQYIKIGQMSAHWVWNNKAWNKDGRKIDHQGNLVSNLNTNGLGGGEVSFTNGSTLFDLIGEGQCVLKQTVISGGVSSTTYFPGGC